MFVEFEQYRPGLNHKQALIIYEGYHTRRLMIVTISSQADSPPAAPT